MTSIKRRTGNQPSCIREGGLVAIHSKKFYKHWKVWLLKNPAGIHVQSRVQEHTSVGIQGIPSVKPKQKYTRVVLRNKCFVFLTAEKLFCVQTPYIKLVLTEHGLAPVLIPRPTPDQCTPCLSSALQDVEVLGFAGEGGKGCICNTKQNRSATTVFIIPELLFGIKI